VRALRVAEQRTQAETGVSAAQLAVLVQLDRAAADSLSDLARRTLTDRSSVADVVERLEARRLVRRARGDDKRRTTIVVTPAGRMLLRRAPVAPTSLLASVLATLDDTVLVTLANGIERLSDALGDAENVLPSQEEANSRGRAPRIARHAPGSRS
jgi:DNA-binding MarR family transcriptional regulator